MNSQSYMGIPAFKVIELCQAMFERITNERARRVLRLIKFRIERHEKRQQFWKRWLGPPCRTEIKSLTEAEALAILEKEKEDLFWCPLDQARFYAEFNWEVVQRLLQLAQAAPQVSDLVYVTAMDYQYIAPVAPPQEDPT